MDLLFALPTRADAAGGIGRAYADGLASALREQGHAVEITEDSPQLRPGCIPVIDGLVLPTLLDQLPALQAAGAVAIMHHAAPRPNAQQVEKSAIRDALAQMLPCFRRVICTGQPVADALIAEFGVIPSQVGVVHPGIGPLPRATAPDGPCRILTTGVLTPRKNQDFLLHALARLRDLSWSLLIAGAPERNPAYAAQLAADVVALGLNDRVSIRTDASDLDAEWRTASLFALTSRWEAYPAGVAQALRRGIPVIATPPGGVLVPEGAGAVCPMDDGATLSKVLRRLLFDRTLRVAMAEGAWQAGQALPDWPTQARAFAAALET